MDHIDSILLTNLLKFVCDTILVYYMICKNNSTVVYKGMKCIATISFQP